MLRKGMFPFSRARHEPLTALLSGTSHQMNIKLQKQHKDKVDYLEAETKLVDRHDNLYYKNYADNYR